ncbi:hypothetical protein LRS10_13830 [Phenylobacterium sp. J426]|uniref:hypothetical protein n=1 Tax=Phenylobacterium sp. J426 TaxID=2898439 RepID=UPI002150DB8D|nr:hypothetical protein [Phenylobacterium sp. J426]MCR5875173.1 hypothetical protein [Phenylobacterium sp. J426]
MRGGAQRVERDRKNARYLAWHMLRPHGGKDFPSLESFVEGSVKTEPTKVQTGPELYHVMRRWEAASGAQQARGAQLQKRRSKPREEP